MLPLVANLARFLIAILATHLQFKNIFKLLKQNVGLLLHCLVDTDPLTNLCNTLLCRYRIDYDIHSNYSNACDVILITLITFINRMRKWRPTCAISQTSKSQPSTLSSWSHWPRGPVDLKSYWPPRKIYWPPFFPDRSLYSWLITHNEDKVVRNSLRKNVSTEVKQ